MGNDIQEVTDSSKCEWKGKTSNSHRKFSVEACKSVVKGEETKYIMMDLANATMCRMLDVSDSGLILAVLNNIRHKS